MSEDNQKPGGKKLAWGAKNIGAHFNPPAPLNRQGIFFASVRLVALSAKLDIARWS